MRRSAAFAAALATIVAGAGVVLTMQLGTAASFVDTEPGAPSQAGAASVVLGRGGDGPELGFADLSPGAARTVDLTVTYAGTAAADLSLSVEADGPSDVCEQRRGRWTARPGVPLTITVGQGDPVAYCSLLDGRRLPLGAAVEGDVRTVPVTMLLGSDAGPAASGLDELDGVTAHAEGGFTDRATGPLRISTATVEPATVPALALAVAEPGAGSDPVDPANPALSARAIAPGATLALPVECVDAGVDPASITEVVALHPALPVWDAMTARGAGSGPFLVLGTDGADTITGSDGGDCIVGGAGADEIDGGDGADVLLGGAGGDHLIGGPQGDRLDGGVDGATCDTTPADTSVGCRVPAAAPAVPTATPPPTAGDAPVGEPVPSATATPPQATVEAPDPATPSTAAGPTEQPAALSEDQDRGEPVPSAGEPAATPSGATPAAAPEEQPSP